MFKKSMMKQSKKNLFKERLLLIYSVIFHCHIHQKKFWRLKSILWSFRTKHFILSYARVDIQPTHHTHWFCILTVHAVTISPQMPSQGWTRQRQDKVLKYKLAYASSWKSGCLLQLNTGPHPVGKLQFISICFHGLLPFPHLMWFHTCLFTKLAPPLTLIDGILGLLFMHCCDRVLGYCYTFWWNLKVILTYRVEQPVQTHCLTYFVQRVTKQNFPAHHFFASLL